MKVLFLSALLCLTSIPAFAAEMTLDFSWRDARGCVALFPNPEIRLRNIPTGAKLVSLALTQGPREMGGQELSVPEDGVIASGTIRTYAPCNPGAYRWTALIRSKAGTILSEAHQTRFYPTDELVSEKP